uniref:7TM_GPCR_Srx domain-containing protein n=1 Tax=Meloidogyne hapla TaxID=6305 RepID=A0A1I8BNB8_MELHA
MSTNSSSITKIFTSFRLQFILRKEYREETSFRLMFIIGVSESYLLITMGIYPFITFDNWYQSWPEKADLNKYGALTKLYTSSIQRSTTRCCWSFKDVVGP